MAAPYGFPMSGDPARITPACVPAARARRVRAMIIFIVSLRVGGEFALGGKRKFCESTGDLYTGNLELPNSSLLKSI